MVTDAMEVLSEYDAPYSIGKAEAFTGEYFRAAHSMSHTVDRYAGHAEEARARA